MMDLTGLPGLDDDPGAGPQTLGGSGGGCNRPDGPRAVPGSAPPLGRGFARDPTGSGLLWPASTASVASPAQPIERRRPFPFRHPPRLARVGVERIGAEKGAEPVVSIAWIFFQIAVGPGSAVRLRADNASRPSCPNRFSAAAPIIETSGPSPTSSAESDRSEGLVDPGRRFLP